MYRANDVIRFSYKQPYMGDEDRYGKILTWRKMSKREIERLNDRSMYRFLDREIGDFQRVGYLLTVEHVDSSIKQYYTKRIPLPPKVSKLVFKIRQMLHKAKNR